MKIKIKVSRLRKKYGDNIVLKDISFEVVEGEIFALLGTNGAGKTTTLECIEGIRKYDGGEITIDGKIGVQLQSSSLPDGIKGSEALKLFAKWNNFTMTKEFTERLGLNEIIKKEYKWMSTGEKRKLHLSLAMIGNPDIIFLDEPTAGLDVEARVIFHKEIKRLKEEGKTIVISSHDMAEVEALCDRLAILKNGNIAFLGTVNELTDNMKKTYKISLKIDKPLEGVEFKFLLYKGEEKEYKIFESNNIHDGLLELLTEVKKENILIQDLKIESATLEDSFMDIAKGEI